MKKKKKKEWDCITNLYNCWIKNRRNQLQLRLYLTDTSDIQLYPSNAQTAFPSVKRKDPAVSLLRAYEPRDHACKNTESLLRSPRSIHRNATRYPCDERGIPRIGPRGIRDWSMTRNTARDRYDAILRRTSETAREGERIGRTTCLRAFSLRPAEGEAAFRAAHGRKPLVRVQPTGRQASLRRSNERASERTSQLFSPLFLARPFASTVTPSSCRNTPTKFLVDRERNVPPLADTSPSMRREVTVSRGCETPLTRTSPGGVYGWLGFPFSVHLTCNTSPFI